MKLVSSYADMEQGHIGTVYQASNWFYLGSIKSHLFSIGGVAIHGRTMSERLKKNRANPYMPEARNGSKLQRVGGLVRHKYVYPLDNEMTPILQGMAIPYPKKIIMRVKQAMA